MTASPAPDIDWRRARIAFDFSGGSGWFALNAGDGALRLGWDDLAVTDAAEELLDFLEEIARWGAQAALEFKVDGDRGDWLVQTDPAPRGRMRLEVLDDGAVVGAATVRPLALVRRLYAAWRVFIDRPLSGSRVDPEDLYALRPSMVTLGGFRRPALDDLIRPADLARAERAAAS